MSQQDKSKTPTATIKIAAKDASQRGSGGTADPGPGDPNAMPSEMPEPVSIPAAPTPSELVVKTAKSGTTNSRVIRTINDPVSLPKSRGSSASRALTSPKSHPGSKEPIDEGQPQPTEGARSGSRSATRSSAKSVASSGGGGGGKAGSGAGPSGGQADSLPRSGTGSVGTGPMGSKRQSVGAVKTLESAGGAGGGGEPEPAGPSASQAMQADSQVGQEHDVVEDGETEIEHPSPSPSPSQAQDEAGPSAGPSAGNKQSGPSSPGVGSSPASSGGGSPKMGPKTSGRKSKKTSDKDSDASDASGVSGSGKKKKKMTKFRYHKRVTVRTHGKKDPTAVMDRVNLKDHKAGITPSSIGEMDPEELMKRAGIKGNKNTHWRVRLRQTKRTTKDGKTTTETKVAYRDSEGNKRIKTSSTPNCQKCNKKLEDCKCD